MSIKFPSNTSSDKNLCSKTDKFPYETIAIVGDLEFSEFRGKLVYLCFVCTYLTAMKFSRKLFEKKCFQITSLELHNRMILLKL